jgi:hypothetical protein
MSEGKAISGVLGGALAGGLITAVGLSRIKPIDAMTLRKIIREELTSGDPTTRKLLTDLIPPITRARIKLNTFFYKDVIIDNNVTGLGATGQQASDPSIIWDDVNKRWLIYFFANVGGNAETYVVESKDLLHMKYLGKAIPKGTSGQFDSVHAHKPGAIYYNGNYYVFYSGDDGTYRRIGVAVSSDGVNFTKHPNNPILSDPEGTGYLDAPTVIRWKDGNFYMWAYNGNGYNLIFKTTPEQFPLGWTLIGKLESRFFGIFSCEAFYDDEIDKIILLANIFYPKPSGVSEPVRTGYLAIYVGDEPLKLTYYGVLLPSLTRDTRSYPLAYCQRNVFAPSIAKVGSGKYVVLFNCTEDGSISSERIFRMDLGVDKEQTLHIINIATDITTSPYQFTVLRLPPGTKAILKHALIYAFGGTPSQIYIFDGAPATYQDNIISWTDTSRLEFTGEITINGEYLGITVFGGSSSNSIAIAYSLEIIIKPSIDEI